MTGASGCSSNLIPSPGTFICPTCDPKKKKKRKKIPLAAINCFSSCLLVAFFCFLIRLVILYSALHFVNDTVQGAWIFLSSLKGTEFCSPAKRKQGAPLPVFVCGRQGARRLQPCPVSWGLASWAFAFCIFHGFIQFVVENLRSKNAPQFTHFPENLSGRKALNKIKTITANAVLGEIVFSPPN